MDRLIGRWSYWLGIASLTIGIVWRMGNAFSFWPVSLIRRELDVSYMTFLHLGFLLFILTMASASFSWVNSRK